MSIGQREKATQKRVIKLFVQELGYTYLGDFTERKNANIETELLTKFLTRKGYLSASIRLPSSLWIGKIRWKMTFTSPRK